MGKTLQDSELSNKVRNRLIERKGKLTWEALANELNFNQGYLYRVANGKRPASKRLRDSLGIQRPRRCYDLSDKEARRIAVDILGIIHG